MENEIVTINVGGELYTTTGATLRALPNTLLADLLDPTISLDDTMLFHNRMFNYGVVTEKQEKTHANVEILKRNKEISNRVRNIYFTKTTLDVFPKYLPKPKKSTPVDEEYLYGSLQESASWGSFVDDLSHPSEMTIRPMMHYFHLYCPIELPPSQAADLFVDRSSVLMPYIMDAYRLGQLHLPALCSHIIREELDFWKIPENLISECCWKKFYEGLRTVKVVKKIKENLHDKYDNPTQLSNLSKMGLIWLTMEKPRLNFPAKVWCLIYYLFVLASCISFMMVTVDEFRQIKDEFASQEEYLLNETMHENRESASNHVIHELAITERVPPLVIIEDVLRIFFTLEFLVRLTLCPEKKAFLRETALWNAPKHIWASYAGIRYPIVTANWFVFCLQTWLKKLPQETYGNGHNILDIFILLFVWSKQIVRLFTDRVGNVMTRGQLTMLLTALQCIRCTRVFHLIKHVASLKVMYLAIRASIVEIALLTVIMSTTVLLFGTFMYLAEILTCRDKCIHNIPVAVWWALITITTVGYGDVYPSTPLGYIIGGICAVCGILVLALPVAIVAANFSRFYENMTSGEQSFRREPLQEKWRRATLCLQGGYMEGYRKLRQIL